MRVSANALTPTKLDQEFFPVCREGNPAATSGFDSDSASPRRSAVPKPRRTESVNHQAIPFGLAAGLALVLLAAVTASDTLIRIATAFRPVGALIVNGIRMVVTPLVMVVVSLAVGRLGGAKKVGKSGGYALGLVWFHNVPAAPWGTSEEQAPGDPGMEKFKGNRRGDRDIPPQNHVPFCHPGPASWRPAPGAFMPWIESSQGLRKWLPLSAPLHPPTLDTFPGCYSTSRCSHPCPWPRPHRDLFGGFPACRESPAWWPRSGTSPDNPSEPECRRPRRGG